MSSTNFEVGSVVYFLATKTEKVLPAQIIERIDRTSLDGIKSTYIISVKSSSEGLKKVEVDPEKTELFSSPDDMKQYMVQRASEAISYLVQQAVSASSIFEVPTKKEEPTGLEHLGEFQEESWHVPAADRPIKKKNKKKESFGEDQNYAEVDLGNGKKARLKM